MLACLWRHVYGVQRQFGDTKELRYRNLTISDCFNFVSLYITVHMNRLIAELLVDRGISITDWLTFSRIQRRKYDTIVNIQ